MARPLPRSVSVEEASLIARSPVKAGTTRTDWRGVEQLWVPPGCFRRGADPAQESGNGYETPQHDVCLTRGFWIDKYEVTHASFDEFVKAGSYGERVYWSDDGWRWKGSQTGPQPAPPEYSDARQPRVWITWFEAEAYARWRNGVLPSETQWEYAARGPESRTYPWGNDWDVERANVGESGHARTVRVDLYPRGVNWIGASQMAGNAWEWTADWYDANLYRRQALRDPDSPSSGTERAFRGGSYASFGSTFLWFESPPDSVRSARRSSAPPDTRSVTRGTRVISSE